MHSGQPASGNDLAQAQKGLSRGAQHIDALDFFAAIATMGIEISAQKVPVQVTEAGLFSFGREQQRKSRVDLRPEAGKEPGYPVLLLRLHPHDLQIFMGDPRSPCGWSAFTCNVTHDLTLINRQPSSY